jgi:hypothetical protein
LEHRDKEPSLRRSSLEHRDKEPSLRRSSLEHRDKEVTLSVSPSKVEINYSVGSSRKGSVGGQSSRKSSRKAVEITVNHTEGKKKTKIIVGKTSSDANSGKKSGFGGFGSKIIILKKKLESKQKKFIGVSAEKAANVIIEFSERNCTDTEPTISLVDPEEVKREILESNDVLDRIIRRNVRNSKKIELSNWGQESPAWLSKKTDALGVSVLGRLNSNVFNFNKSTINAEDNYEPPQGVRNKLEALRNPNFTPTRNQHDGGEIGQTLFSGSNDSDSTPKYKILTQNQNPTIVTNPRSQNSKNHDLIGKLMTNNNNAISIRSKREITGVDILGRRLSDLTEGPRQDSKTRIQRQLDEFRRGRVLLLTRI